uniref:Uncharacterized protein n=1 Tax=Staphylococcus aureus TaxID=1280 RepID=Q8VVS4_STAAU|nr:unnamed protein product [Staphylococcus aureus]
MIILPLPTPIIQLHNQQSNILHKPPLRVLSLSLIQLIKTFCYK